MSTPNAAVAPSMPDRFAADFYRQLSELTDGGMTLAEAVALLKNDPESAPFVGTLGDLAQELGQGVSLSSSMVRHPSMFSAETAAVIEAAERENALPGALAMLADDHDLRPRARLLSIVQMWPLILLALLFVLTATMMIFVIPAFREVFTSFGADLPALTLILLAVSNLIVGYWWLFIAVVIALIFLLPRLRRQKPGFASALDRIWMKVPGVKKVLTKLLAARLSALLAGAAACRIPYGKVIAYLRSTLANGQLRDMVAALERDAAQGGSLAAAAAKHSWVPVKFARIADIGERSGKAAPALARAARVLYGEAEQGAAVFRQGVLVATYIFTGIVVGIVVIAMYLPIFKLGAVV